MQCNKAKYLHSQNQWYFCVYFPILLRHHTSLNILINIFHFWWRFRHWQNIFLNMGDSSQINMLDLNNCCWLYWWFCYIKYRDPKQHCTLREAGARASGHTESSGGHSERGHVLLGLKEDDVDLWSEEAAQHYWTAQTHRDAHGSGLYLREYTQKSDYTTFTFRQWPYLSDSYSLGVLTWDLIYFSIELNSKVLPKPMRLKMYLKRTYPCA